MTETVLRPFKFIIYKGAQAGAKVAFACVFIVGVFIPLITLDLYHAFQNDTVREKINFTHLFFSVSLFYALFICVGYFGRKKYNPDGKRLAAVDSPATRLAISAALLLTAFARYMGW